VVAKIAGLASGALVASVAVWAFNDWRHVSDEDLLFSALTDHCMPYIVDGTEPFVGEGRPIGVYDNVEIVAELTTAQSRLMYDDRFVASWGEVEGTTLRVCRVAGRPIGASAHAFAVDPDGFVERVTQAVSPLGDLSPTSEVWNGGSDVIALGWMAFDGHYEVEPQVTLSVDGPRITKILVSQDRVDAD
jgi:hypothetical protein